MERERREKRGRKGMESKTKSNKNAKVWRQFINVLSWKRGNGDRWHATDGHLV
jgi:hypothetical protein